MMIDTHCHLDNEYYENVDEVIKRMENNKIIVSSVDIPTTDRVVELINKYDNIYGVVGFHPENVNDIKEEDFEYLESIIKSNKKIVGIGEIGLDYHFTKENIFLQKEIFIRQIELAKKYNKTIVIHSRDAAFDTLNILKDNLGALKAVLHCYGYSYELAKEFLKLNVKFGIGGVVTFKNGSRLKEVVEKLDISNFVLETDSPFMAPEPIRGTVNEPYNIKYVALKIAEIKNIPFEDVLKITYDNSISLFDIKDLL